MPGIMGPELAVRLRALHPEMKILFTSGYTQNEIARHGIEEGNLNFIAKPYSIRTLAEKIREVLR
jgi:two-component system cell cycle sensor histidine kinase/response regulator CckA